MKPVRRTDSTSQSCSCTSCLYKSESEQPSIRKYAFHGSRIDRLYYGKYIPSRERKLLNRLVRTRAVYDDLRARLISDSTLSLEKNADLRPGKHRRVIKTLDSNKSGAILELVDIIDKGAALDPKNLSECCSCCSCSSKSKILEGTNKEHKHKKGYARTHEHGYDQIEQAGTGEAVYTRTYERKYGKAGQIGTGEGYGGTYERVYNKIVPGKTRERHNKRGVWFKAKHIRSDPCTCTFKFSGLINKHSKAMFRKIRPPLEEPYFDVDQYIVEKSKNKTFARKSFQKYKKLRDKLDYDIKKLNESRANMQQNLQLHARKSIEQVKQAKNKMKKNIESGVRKSVQAVKALHPKGKDFESVEYPEMETNFKIRKDSIIKFKDYLKRKEIMKDWECDLECEPEICVPEECFKILKLRRSQKRNRHHDRNRGTRYEMINREMKVGGVPLSKSNSGVQAGHFEMTTATYTKKHTPILRGAGEKQLIENRLLFESKKENKDGLKKRTKKVAKNSETSFEKPVKYKESINTLRDNKNKGYFNEKKVALKDKEHFVTKDDRQLRGRQAVRISSSFSFDLEFHKNPHGKNVSLSSQPSGIHMHTPRHKDRKVYRRHKKQRLVLKPTIGSSQGTQENTSKTRTIQTDNYVKTRTSEQEKRESNISQCECKKRLSNVKINTDYATKSVSSGTNPFLTTDKGVFKEVKQKRRVSQVSLIPARLVAQTAEIKESHPYKQAVRIGSTFSFNVEFYKKDNQNEIKTLPVKENVKQTRSKNIHVGRKLVQIKGRSVKAYSQAKTTLHRCFCTLKLNKRPKKKTKKSKTHSVTCLCEIKPPGLSMVDKYVETKNKTPFETSKPYHLLPYECEPGICIPEECDPIVCKKIIDLRKQRFKRRISKSIGSYTGPRRTKSTSSIVSTPITSAKAKIVQSSIVPTKTGRTNAPRRYREALYLGHNELNKPKINISNRQAVRIGSSFSFNIEFYKDKHNPVAALANKPSSSSMPPEIKYKNRNFEDKHVDNRNKSMFAQNIKTGKYKRPSLKNCLCTLKLYKNKAPYLKTHKKPTKPTANTQTVGETSVGEAVDKGTKTKKERQYKLLSYECEPYVCVPGECDPYICLQRIKKRNFNTRNVSAYTDKPDMKSMSSFTENSFKKSEAILVQPKLLRKGINARTDYIEVFDGKPKLTRETFKGSKSKQAVRVGSSFEFSIEFTKKLPGTATVNNLTKVEPVSKDHPKLNRDRGITVTKVRVDHVDTQAIEPRKMNKAALVRPMLKRCFCTLNLHKKTKQQHRKDLKSESKYFGPKVYTVGRATTTETQIISHSFVSQTNVKLQREPKSKIISISTSSFLLNKYMKSVNSKYAAEKFHSTFKTPIQLKEPIIIKSKLSMKIDITRKLCLYKDCRLHYINTPVKASNSLPINETSQNCSKLIYQRSFHNFKNNIESNKFVEQCFCTMNVQISKHGGTSGMNKISKKLKAYECEPGVCIPGECNPYECNKLIMRRLTRNVQKTSGTESKSMSSYTTSHTGLDSKSNQAQTHLRSHAQLAVPEKYKSQRSRKPKQRQAVRIKSSFSFDLEFYKRRSQPFENKNKIATITNTEKHINPKIYKTLGKRVQIKEVNGKDEKFQSTVASVHKGTAPMTKRCFCTLKLQKKGRIRRDTLHANHPTTTTLRNARIGTTNKNDKIVIDPNDLRLYECKPGICVPGECDPYLCLELMKNQKDLGINTFRKETNSVSSMTNEEQYKSRAVDATNKKTRHKATRALKQFNDVQESISYMSGRKSRPAVRIGSSFSFNIEFYKDTPLTQQNEEKKNRRVMIENNDTKQTRNKKEAKIDLSPSSKGVFHKATLTEKPLNQDAMTTRSFMKRCFCTKNLVSTKVLKSDNKKTFKHKCLCLLGLKSNRPKEYQPVEKNDLQSKDNNNFQPTINPAVVDKKKKIYKPVENPVHTVEKPTNTNYKHKTYLPYLEPYECEPGICIPGQCNPHFCKKMIEQRLRKQHSKRSETESVRTQSVSSSFENHKKQKNEKTQAQNQIYEKQLQYVSKPKMHLGETPSNADKRLVRIGSNFSFNIEFYKDGGNGNVIRDKIREVKTYPTKNVDHELKAPDYIPKRIETQSVSVRSNKNKIRVKKVQTNKPKKNEVAGTSPLLKRCFCTLKLLNKPIDQIEQIKKENQLDTKPIITTKSVETQSHKHIKGQLLKNEVLSPYECEPFVCVPGECNPAECLKRIMRRQQTKDSGTITKYPKKKSIGNVANKKKDENMQVKLLNPTPKKGIQNTNYVFESRPKKFFQPRQAVRIGSNFSFNIEFFKDIDLPKKDKDGPLEDLYIENSKEIKQKHTKSQPSYIQHNLGSQVETTKMQTAETTMAQLRRCFCTLSLKDGKPIRHQNTSIKLQTVQPTSDHSSVGEFIRKCICTLKLNKVGKQQKKSPPPAVKYKITGTSTATRGSPQDRFTKQIRSLEPYECEPFVCVPGDCNPHECLKRIQKRQVRNFGTDYRRNLKDCATDSIKQPRTKSTKAQYHQKRKINSRGTSVAPKRTRSSKEEGQLSSYPHNTNRRVVRIGSNFSFNVEFFKDHLTTNTEPKKIQSKKVPNIEKLPIKQPVKPPTKSKGSIYSLKRIHHKKSQYSCPKTQVRSPNVNITPKRCFCTLKLLNKPNNPKFKENLLSPSITTKDKMTTTKIKHVIPQELGVYECPPLMCIPGQCNPYDCLEKIKRREVTRKPRNVGTRIARTPIASVGNQALNLKIRKAQSQVVKKRNVVASTAHSEPQSEILKSSRVIENANLRNKRAVRIGSNFNFNVEFFKQKSQPAVITVPKIVKTRRIKEDSPYLNKNVTAATGNSQHYNSYMNNIKLKDQASDTGNLLKRCFCTLQLQKPTHEKRPRARKLRPDVVRYPHAFTVGRVAVEPFFNSPLKRRDKPRSISINTKLLHRTVGTKTNKKYLQNIEFPSSQCNPNNCPDYQKKSFRKKTNNDMQTILPYTPSKFNKRESRTYLSKNNKYNKVHTVERSVPKRNDILISAAGKRRLTAKKSEKSIPTNSMDTNSICRSSFFCRCIRFLSRKPNVFTEENLSNTYKPPKETETTYHPAKIKLVIPPKKAKSFGDDCPSICPKNAKENSNSQNGDVEKSKIKARTKTMFNDVQSKRGRNFESKHPQMRVTFADTSDYAKNNMPKRKTDNTIHSKSRLCYSCSVNDCPLKFNKLKGKQQISGDSQSFAKSNKKGISYSELADDCQYCKCCKRKIDVDEISKGGGDRRSTISSNYDANSNTCPCGKESPNSVYEKKHSLTETSRAAKLSQKYYDKTDKCCSKIVPLLEMRLDSVDHDLINKIEVKKKITELSINNRDAKDTKLNQKKTKHRDECVCCKCQRKRKMAGKGAFNILSKFRKYLPKKNINPTKPVKRISTKPSVKYTNPCICGSKKCIAELKRKRKAKPMKGKSKYGKICICGSGVCSTESKILKRKKEKIANKARRKVQSVAEKRERKAVMRRVKIQEAKDEIRRRKRIKRNKELENRVKKYKNASDVILAVDSLGDIAKLGVSTLTGALRHTTKTFVDPKVACEILCKKCKKKDPETLIKQLQKDYKESDAASTMRRLKMRCLFMKKVQSLKQKLEENPVTHFIMHLADKNPKTRMFKRKPVRRIREPLDFQCSLYMATLRKRPYLSVYYKWPWFYPHFITMLNIWRQFTDIMLFLLAAVVWSPCILCMEGCRALMCCFFCTG